jgi:hypothetical protein
MMYKSISVGKNQRVILQRYMGLNTQTNRRKTGKPLDPARV